MIDGPPRRWIAPSTPPPPASAAFPALTIASATNVVMSPRVNARMRSPTRSSSIRGTPPAGQGPVVITSCGGFAAASRLLK